MSVAAEAGLPVAASYLSQTELLSDFDGDLAFVHDLVELFLMRCPELMMDIQTAAQRDDGQATRDLAHALKGCASYFDRGGFSLCAEQIERLPAAEEWRLPALLRELEAKATELSLYLAAEFPGARQN